MNHLFKQKPVPVPVSRTTLYQSLHDNISRIFFSTRTTSRHRLFRAIALGAFVGSIEKVQCAVMHIPMQTSATPNNRIPRRSLLLHSLRQRIVDDTSWFLLYRQHNLLLYRQDRPFILLQRLLAMNRPSFLQSNIEARRTIVRCTASNCPSIIIPLYLRVPA